MSRVLAAVPGRAALADDPGLTAGERDALARMAAFTRPQLKPSLRGPLDRLLRPVNAVTREWDDPKRLVAARNVVLMEVHRRQAAYWAWDEDAWSGLAASPEPAARLARFHVVALGYLFGGHHQLHHRAGIVQITRLADMVFGRGAVQPALEQVRSALLSWKASKDSMSWQIINAAVDLLLSCGSPRLEDITQERLLAVAADHRPGRSERRRGLFKISRVLADKGIIPAPLSSNQHNRGPQPDTLATVPAPWPCPFACQRHHREHADR